MRFNLIDWSLLALLTAIAFATSHLGLCLILASAPTSMMLVSLALASVLLFFVLLHPLAPWLILRRRVNGLRLMRWLLAYAFGFALGMILSLPEWAFGEPRATLLSPDRAGAVQMLIKWITSIAACVALYLPPGLLLQRLSSTSAWPFIIAAAASMLTIMLIGSTATLSLVRGGPSLATFAAVGFGLGAIHGLGSGAGLFLMARRSERSR